MGFSNKGGSLVVSRFFYFLLLCLVFSAKGESPSIYEEDDNPPPAPLDFSPVDLSLIDFNLVDLSWGFLPASSEEEPHSLKDKSPSSSSLPLLPDRAKPCVWFLKSGIENEDDFFGNSEMFDGAEDHGYTHGHITSLLRSCSSGSDLSFRLQ